MKGLNLNRGKKFVWPIILAILISLFFVPTLVAFEPPLKWKYNISDPISVKVTEDGGYIAIQSPNLVQLFATNGTLLWNEHLQFPPEYISVSNNGRFIAIGSQGRFVYLFKDGKLVRRNQEWFSSRPLKFHELLVSVDGNYLIAGTDEEAGGLYLKNNRMETDFNSYLEKSKIRDISVSKDGSIMGAATKRRAYFLTEGKILWNYGLDDSDSSSVSISPDGKYLAIAYGKTVGLLDKNGVRIWNYSLNEEALDISLSDNGNYLIVAALNKLYFFDKKGEILWFDEINRMNSASVSSNGKYVAATSFDNTVYFYENKPKITNVANSIDKSLGSEFFEYMENQGLEIVQLNATEFEQKKDEKFVVILGGPDAPEGIGEIVQEVLNESEQEQVRQSEAMEMYVKEDVWATGQMVVILAGSTRQQTREAARENRVQVASNAEDVAFKLSLTNDTVTKDFNDETSFTKKDCNMDPPENASPADPCPSPTDFPIVHAFPIEGGVYICQVVLEDEYWKILLYNQGLTNVYLDNYYLKAKVPDGYKSYSFPFSAGSGGTVIKSGGYRRICGSKNVPASFYLDLKATLWLETLGITLDEVDWDWRG
jgi:DNA-binding beta-propeller fold protein YncE